MDGGGRRFIKIIKYQVGYFMYRKGELKCWELGFNPNSWTFPVLNNFNRFYITFLFFPVVSMLLFFSRIFTKWISMLKKNIKKKFSVDNYNSAIYHRTKYLYFFFINNRMFMFFRNIQMDEAKNQRMFFAKIFEKW